MSANRPGILRARISRRKFAQAATVAAAGAVMMPGVAIAQTEESKSTASPPSSSPPLTSAEEAEADARTDAILRKYGARMTDAEKADVRRQVREGQKSLTEFRAFPLANADAPAVVLNIRPRNRR